MKKFSVSFAIFAFALLSSCSDKKLAASDVPQPAMAAFNAKYPGATNIAWIKEKKGDKLIYEAQFKVNDKEIEAEFDADGNLIAED